MVNRDSVPRDFEYTMVTAYLPKGIRVVRTEQDKITALNFNDFNLGDRKIYGMLAPYKYLTRTKAEEIKDHTSVMDDEPHAVHPAKCHEDPTLRKTPGSQCLCQDATIMLPWRLTYG
jgi:hypothetical protein